jgi:hypothetical protein
MLMTSVALEYLQEPSREGRSILEVNATGLSALSGPGPGFIQVSLNQNCRSPTGDTDINGAARLVVRESAIAQRKRPADVLHEIRSAIAAPDPTRRRPAGRRVTRGAPDLATARSHSWLLR